MHLIADQMTNRPAPFLRFGDSSTVYKYDDLLMWLLAYCPWNCHYTNFKLSIVFQHLSSNAFRVLLYWLWMTLSRAP